jgi:hypothetical protein
MLDAELLKSIAAQLMASASVSVEGESAPVRRTSRQHLRTAGFTVGGREYQAIEQNPEAEADGGNWRGVVIKWCNPRTWSAIPSWRLLSMARLRFTEPAKSGRERSITSSEKPKVRNAASPAGEWPFAQMPGRDSLSAVRSSTRTTAVCSPPEVE